MIRIFGYLAWRSARNRVARQLAPPPQPEISSRAPARAGVSLVHGHGAAARRRPPASWPTPARSSWSARSRLLGAVAWGWIFGVERRVLAFSPAEVTFLFSGPVSRRGLIQFKLLRSQLLILFNALLWTLILSRERFGVSPWLRVISIWVLLTTLSFHRLGASFVRTSLSEHGRLGARHRVVSLVVLGVVLIALTWSIADALPATRRGRARTPTAFLSALREAAAQPLPTRPDLSVPGDGPPADRPQRCRVAPRLVAGAVLLVLHYIWVVRSDTAFEEAAAEVSLQQAQALSERRAGAAPVLAAGPDQLRLFRLAPDRLARRRHPLEEPGRRHPDPAGCGTSRLPWRSAGWLWPSSRSSRRERWLRSPGGSRSSGPASLIVIGPSVGAQRSPGRPVEARSAPELSRCGAGRWSSPRSAASTLMLTAIQLSLFVHRLSGLSG